MSDEIREIGGNKLALKWGKFLEKKAKKYINKGSKTIISNPSCNFPNPFTLIITFTVDNTLKYQLVNQGKFVEQYKIQSDTEDCPLSTEEMFRVITMSRERWYKKEI